MIWSYNQTLFGVSGKDRVCVRCDIHAGGDSQDYCLWLRSAFWCLPPKWMECFRFCHSCYWVSTYILCPLLCQWPVPITVCDFGCDCPLVCLLYCLCTSLLHTFLCECVCFCALCAWLHLSGIDFVLYCPHIHVWPVSSCFFCVSVWMTVFVTMWLCMSLYFTVCTWMHGLCVCLHVLLSVYNAVCWSACFTMFTWLCFVDLFVCFSVTVCVLKYIHGCVCKSVPHALQACLGGWVYRLFCGGWIVNPIATPKSK